MAQEAGLALTDADQAILFMMEAGFDLYPWQWNVMIRAFDG